MEKSRIKYNAKRIIEKIAYGAGCLAYGLGSKMYFDLQVSGKENLPKGSAVLAFNHTFGLDGIFDCLGLFPRQIHHTIQFEGVYNKNRNNRLCSWAVGFIPLSIGQLNDAGVIKEDSVRKDINKTGLKRSKDYLQNYGDFVGVFIDGPACRLLDPSGKPIPKYERKVSKIGAMISLDSERPLIPVGTWMPEDIAEKLWEFGDEKKEENMIYLRSRKQGLKSQGKDYLIPIQINIGLPIYSELMSGRPCEKRKELTEFVEKEIVRLSQKR